MYKLIRQENTVFLDWYYYHEAIAEFAVRHWAVPYAGCGFKPIARSAKAIQGNDLNVSRIIFDFCDASADVFQGTI